MPAESALRDGDAPDFQLIETLRWEASGGFVRLDLHLARLYASAHALGFACDPQRVGEVLATVSSEGSQRIRLMLARGGDLSVATQPFVPSPVGSLWKLGIAARRLDATDPLIFHKTTHRDVYAAARAEFSEAEADEVLLLNKQGMVCEGTFTNLFLVLGEGPLVTPASSCGLLPGVLRRSLLDSGKAIGAQLSVDDLHRASMIFVGNSLRGLIRARLADGPAN